MSASGEEKTKEQQPDSRCFTRSVIHALFHEPALEAVTINRARNTLSLATLGRADEPRVEQAVADSIRNAYHAGLEEHCMLLEGKGECRTCRTPLSNEERSRITIQHDGDKTTIARVTCPTAPSFWRWRDIPWPRVVQRDVGFVEDADHLDEHINEWKAQLAAAVLCGVLGLTGFIFRDQSWSIAVFVASYLAGSWFTAQEVWERLRQRAIDVHFLMLAVAAGSASIGAWGEGATLLFLFSLSGALEHFALGRTQKEIRSLFRDAPKVATVIDSNGVESEVRVEALKKGMRLLLKPGSQIPADAEIVKGRTSTDESTLTGEAAPVDKDVGDTVFAGTLNLWGAVEASVLRPAEESSLQKIIRLIREAQHQKAPAQKFTDKFSTYYTWFALGMSVVMFFVWWLVVGHPVKSAFYRTMTLLVVASPCALVLSIPSAVLAAIAWSARHGILFRGGAAVEKLADIDVVALDKTGTLTTGELRVETVESFPPGNEKEIAALAYSLERLSTHPLARAITRYGKQQGLEPLELDRFESVTGQGLRAIRNGVPCLLGRRDWLLQEGKIPQRMIKAQAADAGHSEIWLAHGELVGRMVLRDDVRPQSVGVIEALGKEGLQTIVLTGDRPAAAEHLKRELRLDDVRAELRPEQKVAEIRTLSESGSRVAMIGDGVNDAPSLAAAHIGVAMGARGSDAALEQADVVLMHDRLENFLAAFRLSQRARRIIRQNLIVSLGTVAVLVTFALLGRIPLTVGVIGHEGSTVVVVMNSLRLLFGRQGTST